MKKVIRGLKDQRGLWVQRDRQAQLVHRDLQVRLAPRGRLALTA